MGSLLKLRGPKRLIAESSQEPQFPEEPTVQPQSGSMALTLAWRPTEPSGRHLGLLLTILHS